MQLEFTLNPNGNPDAFNDFTLGHLGDRWVLELAAFWCGDVVVPIGDAYQVVYRAQTGATRADGSTQGVSIMGLHAAYDKGQHH
ncbi:predicted protein [Lichtheimia corymbifera JMRC:FSU:9682]|uniref:Uncharacterized protein n=1 Tax=Lichtheimia corymbifera JMRC:FSU:9682 TaxID=1263082 RepID=A0A068S6R8_9FUNG|nr:predicted protein [Lichtheimia corymbifera JMRC:FSU:9682]